MLYMATINFSLLALQFFKYAHNFYNTGILFYLEDGQNLYRDVLTIYRQDAYKGLYFAIQASLWDRYQQFTIYSSSNSTRYHYRVNPVNNSLIQIPDNRGLNLMCNTDPPDELKLFANEVLEIIFRYADKLKYDKFDNDCMERHG